jgi:cytochrome b involved in lipid metabolism
MLLSNTKILILNQVNHMSSKCVTLAELEKHCSPNDLWVAIHGNVYDVTEFAQNHPGGPEVLLEQAGIFQLLF